MNYGTLREPLLESGYKPIPIYPQAKNPAVANWGNLPEPPRGYDTCGVGVVCGSGDRPICAVDIDVLDEALSSKMLSFLLDKYGLVPYRIGKAPKVLAVYRTERAGIVKRTSDEFACGKVEILNAGQQFVAYGVHPDTKQPYTWPGPLGGIAEIAPDSLPVLNEAAIVDILATFEEMAAGAGLRPVQREKKVKTEAVGDYNPNDPFDIPPPLNLGTGRVEELLSKIDADCSRETWRNIGMALHHEYGGSPEGLGLWEAWSAKGSKYKEGEPEKQWDSFGKSLSRPLTAAYLLKTYKDFTTVTVATPTTEKTSTQSDPVNKVNPRTFFQSLSWSTSRFLAEPPEIPMIIDGMLPKGIVGMMFADGGAGKSTWMLYLCAKFSIAGLPMELFGHRIHPGKVVIVTAEDPELVLNHRFVGVVRSIAAELNISVEECRCQIDMHFSIVSTFGHTVGLFKLMQDGTLQVTDYYLSLLDALNAMDNLQMVVIDTKTRFSPGEGQGNVLATSEIGHYEGIAAKTGATVMLLHHTNKASRAGGQTGKTAFRDASALYDSVRFAWYMRALTTKECEDSGIDINNLRGYFLLECAKANYTMVHDSYIVHRHDGYGYTKFGTMRLVSKLEKKMQSNELSSESLVHLLQSAEGDRWSKQDIRKLGERAGLTAVSAIKYLELAIHYGFVVDTETGAGTGARHHYSLSSTGKTLGLTIAKEVSDDE